MAFTTKMRRDHKPRSGICLGGIGTGSVELRADGVFYNWNIFNNSPFGSGPKLTWPEDSMLFFIVRYEEEDGDPQMKILQIDSGYEVAGLPSHIYSYPWLTGVDEIEYSGTFPFVEMTFRDAEMPFDVEMEAWSPFIPHNADDSSLPCAVFRFRLTPKTNRPVHVMLMASMRSGVGYDVEEKVHASGLKKTKGYVLFEHGSGGVDRKHSSWGTQALASLSGTSTYYLDWEHRHPYYETVIANRKLLDVDDTVGRNIPDKKTGKRRGMTRVFSSVASSTILKKGRPFEHAFVMTWHFPNLYARSPGQGRGQVTDERTGRIEGHHYANRFGSATEVAEYVIGNRARLHALSRAFVDDFYDSSAPEFVLDQINSHLNTFRTSAWLTKAGDFGVQEGMTPKQEWGPLATVDVSMYGSLSQAGLFPELDKASWRAHKRLQFPTGEICHGVGRNFGVHDEEEGVTGRIDLVPQYAIMALRAYFWTDDLPYLKEMWPSVKKALEFSIMNRDANGDGLPDHEGARCTYDNFPMYGAGSYSGSLWLAGIAYAVEAASVLGDGKAERRYSELLTSARESFERKLWNGKYYRLYNDEGHVRTGMGADHPDLDEGCLADQLIGQWAANMIGAEPIANRGRIRKALRAAMKMCSRPYGLTNCGWPGDQFLHPVHPDVWVDQANTCWSGVELGFAALLICEGLYKEGLKVIRNVDRRYRKAGMYWDHQEFGGHYFRPMSAWGIVNAMLGLTVNGSTYGFAPKVPGRDVKLFFSFGHGTAHYTRRIKGKKEDLAIDVRTGTLQFSELRFELARGSASKVKVSVGGKSVPASAYAVEPCEGGVIVAFRRKMSAGAGQTVRVSCA